VYYELDGEMVSAITRQKQIKKWNHAGLIEAKSEMDRSVRRDSVRGY
jgi:hypothetical protein